MIECMFKIIGTLLVISAILLYFPWPWPSK